MHQKQPPSYHRRLELFILFKFRYALGDLFEAVLGGGLICFAKKRHLIIIEEIGQAGDR